ncbi:MAG: methylmalonyl Co-A mutase-associated GTPase MeaB [Halioglobus sp.]|nr:methylmalonyl Co-A mutase-associated GTPase MeaB [Halioglobus sp.]
MDVAGGVLAGTVAAGARAIRWLDDRDPRGVEVLTAVYAHTGRAQIVGVTGPPGAGKSTLVSALVGEQRRRGRRVGVIAIDPSSPFTGGAILGDRVRMARHSVDPDVFIRSIGTRGYAGGLSRSAHDACLILDAMGYEIIFVETVGVGQDEIDIVSLAHTTLIIGVPGLGDEVQAVKAGLLETGDLFVINKADRAGYEATLRQFELMLHLRAQAVGAEAAGWTPPVLRAVATRDEGIAEIVDATDEHARTLRASGEFDRRSARRERAQALTLAVDEVQRELRERADPSILAAVEARRLDPYAAAELLLANWRQQ